MKYEYADIPAYLPEPRDVYDLGQNIAHLDLTTPKDFKLKAEAQRRIFGHNIAGKANISIHDDGIMFWKYACFGHDYIDSFYTFRELWKLVEEKKQAQF